jgi:AcrR family transcriptional regulator
MPRRVDHDERRRQIAEALWRIASTRGLQAVSLREVAAEAGLSMRLVQYYCKTKHNMLLFALDELNRRSDAAASDRVAATSEPRNSRSVLRAMLVENLPVDADRRLTATVYLAYFVRALTDPDLAELFRKSRPLAEEQVAGWIRQGQRDGTAATDIDPRIEAETLLAVAREAGGEVLLGSRTVEEALALIDYHLDRMFRAEERTGRARSAVGPKTEPTAPIDRKSAREVTGTRKRGR